MDGNTCVRHERGFGLRLNQVLKSIRNGWLTWTDDTHTMVRDCTPAEQWAAQAKLAAERESAPWAEMPGFRVAGLPFGAVREEMGLAYEATQSMAPMPKPHEKLGARMYWLTGAA